MKTLYQFVVGWILFGTLGIAGAAVDAGKSELEKLKGEWTVLSNESEDQALQLPEGAVVTFSRDKMVAKIDSTVLKIEHKSEPLSVKLNPGTQPKQIDLAKVQGSAQGAVEPGIYELEADRLILCLAKVVTDQRTSKTSVGHRPKSFDDKAGVVVVLKRRATVPQFVADSRQQIATLEANFSEFEADLEPKLRYDRVKEVKKLVRAMLVAADSDEKRRELAGLMVASMQKSQRFQFYDYYYLWLGHKAFKFATPENAKDLLYCLVDKVDKRDEVDLLKNHADIRNELCGFAIEVIQTLVDYPQAPQFVRDGKIDWEAWRRFANWLAKNRQGLKFDATAGRLVVPSPK